MTTPFFPTLFIASATSLPISGLADEIVATCSASSVTWTESFLSSDKTSTKAESIWSFKSMGFTPEPTISKPLLAISKVNIEAVVVPSPALSLVF